MRRIPTLIFALLASLPAAAHEFWISPQDYMIEPGEQLFANLRVGQELRGNASPYMPSQFERFEVVMGGKVAPVEGRVGDRPALAMTAPTDGLAIVVHETTDSNLTYREWAKFVKFAEHKDFTWALAEHAARGLPKVDFKERYSRYAKALIAVGDGAGADQEVGLLTEIVALVNPYVADLSDGLPVRVLYKGEPRRDAQVELFQKDAENNVLITLHRTNADGVALLPVKPGHEYLVDAVVLRALEPEEGFDPVWESLWAALTFEVPAAD